MNTYPCHYQVLAIAASLWCAAVAIPATAVASELELTVSTQALVVRFEYSVDSISAYEFTQAHQDVLSLVQPTMLAPTLWRTEVSHAIAEASTRDSLLADSSVFDVYPIWIGHQGHELYPTGELILRLLPNSPRSVVDSLNSEFAQSVRVPDRQDPDRVLVDLKPRGTLPLTGTIANYRAAACFRYVESNTLVQMINLQSVWEVTRDTLFDLDPLYEDQWYLKNTGQSGGTAGADIGAEDAWLITRGSPNVEIAILDVGFDWTHPDIPFETEIDLVDVVGQFWWNPAPDGSPYPCCTCRPPETWQICGHGTSCYGQLVAGHDNESGIRGLAPDCRYFLIKMTDDDGYATTDQLVLALKQTAWSHVVSCSWARPQYEEDVAWQLGALRDSGVVVVFSAGNDGVIEFPASLEADTVIAVGASDHDDYVWDYSGKGEQLDVVAPAGSKDGSGLPVTVTLDISGYDGYVPHECSPPYCNDEDFMTKFGGTSAAAPLAAGTLALVLSRNRNLTGDVETLREILYSSAVDLGPTGFDTASGYGRIDAYRALLSIIRGDMDNNGFVDATDLAFVIDIVYFGGSAPLDVRMADFDCNASIDAVDVAVMWDHVFLGGDPPPICFEYDY